MFYWLEEHASGDPDIHRYFHTGGLRYSIDHLVNVFQAAIKVVIQKFISEGFELTAIEPVWHGKPGIGGNVGGIQV